jgi:integrase
MNALELSNLIEGEIEPSAEPLKAADLSPRESDAQALLSDLEKNYLPPASTDSVARKLAVMPKPKRKAAAPERIHGAGHLYLRGTTYWFEIHHHGQRTRESLNTDDKETAKIRMAKRAAEITQGIPVKKFEPITVQAMYEKWLVEVERNCKERTVEDYKSRWTAHLQPVFGNLMATQVNKQRIAEYLNARMKEGAGEITQNRENRVLQMIFNYNRELVPENFFPTFPKMHSEKAHVRKGRLSSEDYATLLARLDDHSMFWLRALLVLTFKFGFRKGELLSARVGWFDANASVLTLPAYSTKNKTERRVPIQRGGEIYKMLMKLTEGRDADAALLTRNGKPVRDYRGAWAKLTEGITNGRGGHVTVHDLRRSAITGMSNKGIGAEQAGTHLTGDVFRRYISRNEEEEQATAARIEGE